jgi:hypothetical protein
MRRTNKSDEKEKGFYETKKGFCELPKKKGKHKTKKTIKKGKNINSSSL